MKHQGLIERLTSQLQGQGHGEGARRMAVEILRKQGSVEQDSEELTKGGQVRDGMTPEERAIDRQSKYTGKPKAAFRYDAQTNRATVRQGYGRGISAAVLKKVFRGR